MSKGSVHRGRFGFTNQEEDFQAVQAWKEAAIADGWSHEPMYAPHEGEDRATCLKKDGWVAQVMTRTRKAKTEKWAYEACVTVWGPDGLQIRVPDIYDWAELQKALRNCHYCDKTDVKTFRIAFAGRGCKECADRENKALPKNWCD